MCRRGVGLFHDWFRDGKMVNAVSLDKAAGIPLL